MVSGRHVEERVISVACASAIEAVEANIEASGIVLSSGQLMKFVRALQEVSRWSQSTEYSLLDRQTGLVPVDGAL
jgi:hypothetical protein